MNSDVKSLRNEMRAELRQRFPRERGQLLPALHHLQHEFGYLPDWGMEVVGWHLGIPASEVYGAATSYSELRLQQPGEHVVRVCTGLSCKLSGAESLAEAASEQLGLAMGETDAEGAVTLEETACAYLCAVAPAVSVDGVWTGRASLESVHALLEGVSST